MKEGITATRNKLRKGKLNEVVTIPIIYNLIFFKPK